MVIYFGGSAEGMYGQSCGSAKVVPAHIALGLYATWSIGQRLRKKIRDGGDGTICNMLPWLRDGRNHGIVEKLYKLEPMDLDEETILDRLKSLFEYSDNCFFLLRRSHFF